MNGKIDRIVAWMIEIALVGALIYAMFTNKDEWGLVVIAVVFTLFLLVVTDNKNRSS